MRAAFQSSELSSFDQRAINRPCTMLDRRDEGKIHGRWKPGCHIARIGEDVVLRPCHVDAESLVL